MYVTIRDARTGQHITGRHIRDYSNGLTIEDSRGVLHYATTDRVIRRDVTRPFDASRYITPDARAHIPRPDLLG